MKFKFLLVFYIFCCNCSYGQYYQASFKNDVLPLSLGIGVLGLGLAIEGSASDPSLAEINALNPNDLNFLDRGAIDNFSTTAQNASDIIFYSATALPFITYFSNKCRSNGGVIALMALETALLNTGITSIIKGSVERYRPFNYNPNVSEDMKLSSSSNFSFVSGHTSITAAFAFLTARVITDLHPDLNKKYLVWTTAATLPAVIGILRVQAGRHFPTDVIGGYIVGAAIGYFVPSLHIVKDNNIKVSTNGLSGMNVSLKF